MMVHGAGEWLLVLTIVVIRAPKKVILLVNDGSLKVQCCCFMLGKNIHDGWRIAGSCLVVVEGR